MRTREIIGVLALSIVSLACRQQQPMQKLISPSITPECSRQGVFTTAGISERNFGNAIGRTSVNSVGEGIYTLTISGAIDEGIVDSEINLDHPLRVAVKEDYIELVLHPDGSNPTDTFKQKRVGPNLHCNVLAVKWQGAKIRRIVWNGTEQIK